MGERWSIPYNGCMCQTLPNSCLHHHTFGVQQASPDLYLQWAWSCTVSCTMPW